ncbi:MAG: FAD-dependent oxidoreductase [Opitutaceae bacterium]|nr:FAD-dependent oxidoreductase [Opitutaceae bacterium]
MQRKEIAVIGAGVFGAWTAWLLARAGAKVTLVDAWGPSNSRSSSGDESRIIRGAYGPKGHYVRMTDRSFGLWEELEAAASLRLIRRIGALWLFGDDDAFVRDSLGFLRQWNFPLARLTPAEAAARFPQVNWQGVRTVYLEERAGWLLARRAVQEVVARFTAAGGELRIARVEARRGAGGRLDELRLSDGSSLRADRYVFACGPWLGAVLPDWIGPWMRPTRQEVFYFGPPPGEPAYTDTALPAWLDNADGSWYGIPGNEHRGFKISCNDLGEVIDPTKVDRAPDPGRLARARDRLAYRFPGMAGAPLLESRTCQYENTPDRDLIIDRHPDDERVLAVGGGSGHGFKLAPAVGELAAALALDRATPDPLFQVSRFR